MKIAALIAVFLCRLAYAEQTFGIEEPLEHQLKIPAAVLFELESELDFKANGCAQFKIEDALEAAQISVGSKYPTLLVKPTQDAWCLCGAYLCPAWIFQLAPEGARRLWSTPGTAAISVVNARNRGYRRIRSEGGTAGHGFVEVRAWDGKHYSRASRKDWVAGQ